jgi:hypothetical protein
MESALEPRPPDSLGSNEGVEDLQTPVPIESLAYDCLTHFRALIREINTHQRDLAELSAIAIEDQIGRYQIWAGNLGALRTGRSSLDYRLRNAAFVAGNISRLLQSLTDVLKRG